MNLTIKLLFNIPIDHLLSIERSILEMEMIAALEAC